MIKNKTAMSIRWLGVFSTVKKLVEKRLLSPYRNVSFLGEIEIKGQKNIQIRCCNKDTRISKLKGYLCFFDKIDPSRLDYLVCVYLDRYKNIQGHYIFTREEVVSFFPDMIDVNGKKSPPYKGLYIPKNENLPPPLRDILDMAFENWDKIK